MDAPVSTSIGASHGSGTVRLASLAVFASTAGAARSRPPHGCGTRRRAASRRYWRDRNLKFHAYDLVPPTTNVEWVQRHYGVSYPAANNAVARLEQLGLLRETTGGSYGRVFAADDVLRILER
jgi:hypothetical protein